MFDLWVELIAGADTLPERVTLAAYKRSAGLLLSRVLFRCVLLWSFFSFAADAAGVILAVVFGVWLQALKQSVKITIESALVH